MKKLLKKTWLTFFGRFGGMLPIQKKAIPIILDKKDAILLSSTASGKTEGVVAPLIERLLKEDWNKLSILYISPTKALVNDMYARLQEQCQELNVMLTVKTGDKQKFNPRKPPNFLITTPESFDSIICRHPYSLKNLKAVILDEIHLLDNTYRGDQLRILLKRLAKITKTDFNIYALSATIADPIDMGNRYIKNFEVVKSSQKRIIEHSLVQTLEEIYYYVQTENLRKLLIFCNKRVSVELVAKECKRYWGDQRVVVHHGSLSTSVRHEAESFMKETHYGVCVATMTLEIGIDIGSIDAVVLAEIPWTISAMMQRIGRGNRRSNKNRVFAMYYDDEERNLLEMMFKAANDGYIEFVEYSPDYAVIVQQIFSILFANPQGIENQYFLDLFKDFCKLEILIEILKHLLFKEWIVKRKNKYFANTKLMNLGAFGKIHSNIPSIEVYKVINKLNKQVIGEVTAPISDVFILAGRIWRVVHIIDKKIFVKPTKYANFKVKFKRQASKSQFYYFLPEKLREEMEQLE
ncbi:MAG: DEAD/DEAH box helicase [Candidatus Cloacimonetes bacterium]|nr:DEAD/DEAH box helicase [Candidatus Cloacimonadota bacterium]